MIIVVSLILSIIFHIYFILVNIISSTCFHCTVKCLLTHNAVNSSNSLCDASCTMLLDASCQFGMDDVHRAECTMSYVNIVYLE